MTESMTEAQTMITGLASICTEGDELEMALLIAEVISLGEGIRESMTPEERSLSEADPMRGFRAWETKGGTSDG